MTEKSKVDKVSLEGMDPTKPFFLACSVVNNDGSIADFNAGGGDGVEAASELEAECVACLKDLVEEYPTIEGYVFYCVPVKKIWKGHVRVTPLGKKKA